MNLEKNYISKSEVDDDKAAAVELLAAGFESSISLPSSVDP